MNTTMLKSAKWVKLLKEAGLMEDGDMDVSRFSKKKMSNFYSKHEYLIKGYRLQVTKTQADLIFKKLTGLGSKLKPGQSMRSLMASPSASALGV